LKNGILPLLAFSFLVSCNNNSSNPETAKKDSAEVRFPEILTHNDSIDQGLLKIVDTIKGSPFQKVSEEHNGTKITIEYSSPGVKDRIIWGGLVPYDKVWVTGAHQATTVTFSKRVMIGNKLIPAGKYAFFTIPGREKWIAIFNKRFDQHLADEYNEKEDVARIELKPEKAHFTERLTYSLDKPLDNEVIIQMNWEKLELRIGIGLNQ
jgi:hypothetical protein